MSLIKIVIFIVLLSIQLTAQEFGVSYSKMWSDDKQLKNPAGYGIHLYLPIKKIAIKAEYNYASGEGTYFGYLVSGFFHSAQDIPVQENVITKSTMKSYEFSLWIPNLISHINPFQLNLGAGIGLNHLEGDRKGSVSGHEASFSSTDRIGIFFNISISYSRPLDLPLKLEVIYKLKTLPSSGIMVEDAENVFGNAIGLKQLDLGISYILH